MSIINLSLEETVKILLSENPLSPLGKPIKTTGYAQKIDIKSIYFANSLKELHKAIGYICKYYLLIELKEYAYLAIKDNESMDFLLDLSNLFNEDLIMGSTVINQEENSKIYSFSHPEIISNQTTDQKRNLKIWWTNKIKDFLEEIKKKSKKEIKKLKSTSLPKIQDNDGFSAYLISSNIKKFADEKNLKINNIQTIKENNKYQYKNKIYDTAEELAIAYYEESGWQASHCEGASIALALGSILMSVIEENPKFINFPENSGIHEKYLTFARHIFSHIKDVSTENLLSENYPEKIRPENFHFFKKLKEFIELRDVEKAKKIANLIKPGFYVRPYGKNPNITLVEKILETTNWMDIYRTMSVCGNIIGAESPTGWPDLSMVNKSGEILLVEVKSATDKITEAQKKFLSLYANKLPWKFEFAHLTN